MNQVLILFHFILTVKHRKLKSLQNVAVHDSDFSLSQPKEIFDVKRLENERPANRKTQLYLAKLINFLDSPGLLKFVLAFLDLLFIPKPPH